MGLLHRCDHKVNYAFASNTYEFEVYETGEFKSLSEAINHAKTIADEMDMDIEIWEEKITIQPVTSYFDGGMIDDNEALEHRDECLAAKKLGVINNG